MLTLQALMYIEGNGQTGRPVWNYATGTLISSEGCQTELRYPTQLWGSARPWKLYKQPHMGELQQLRNKNDPSFRRTMIDS